MTHNLTVSGLHFRLIEKGKLDDDVDDVLRTLASVI